MKNNLILILFVVFVVACKNEPAKQNQNAKSQTSGTPAAEIKAEVKVDSITTVTYVCPMDPDITSTKAGEKCSKCGMDLVLKVK